MSAGFIADSSVGVAWAVHSQASDATDQLLEDVAAGTPLIVPTLWLFEVANSLLVLLRRKRILAPERDRALRAWAGLPFRVDDEGPRLVLSRSLTLSGSNLTTHPETSLLPPGAALLDRHLPHFSTAVHSDD